jgi:HSP20 family protein
MNMRAILPFSRENRRQQPLTLFDTLQREVDQLFDDFSRGVASGNSTSSGSLMPSIMPSMDVAETDKQIELTVELPGLEQKDVDISVSDNMLTIRGEKKSETEQKDKNFRRVERVYGTFHRVVELPPGIDPSAINATMSNGVLRITVPKPARSETKKIEVKPAA